VSLKFTKYEGLGNDFLVVDARSESELAPERAARLCDRHFGVGGDGVLLVLPASESGARARMLILNADGSRPEMCGNGIRCVALHLALADGAAERRYLIETDAGVLGCDVKRAGFAAEVAVAMGQGRPEGEFVSDFGGDERRFALVSMGNPHAIVFDAGEDEPRIDQFAPLVSRAFPRGTNVEFATTRAGGGFDLVVWERGVGRTLACGTGACATAVAAALAGRAPFDAPIELRLPGGPLQITVQRDTLQVLMRGPARLVFSGEVAAS
jgi:diaminopimelate epimerase